LPQKIILKIIMVNKTSVRQSTRTKKLSHSMRVVDEETRKIVMKTRLDALEGDRLFDELNFGAGDFEAVEGENAEALDDWADDGQDL